MADLRYARLSGADAAGLVEELVALYAVVYAEPPYEEGPEQVGRFARTFPGELRRDGFALTAAFDGSRLVGAAYGWTMPAGGWFSAAESLPRPEILQRPKLAVMEWLVHPGHRGRGVGRGLIGALLVGRPEPWAVLSSDPRSAARGMYERAGWQPCGRSVLPWGPPMDLLALPLEPGGAVRSG